jgi:serine protease
MKTCSVAIALFVGLSALSTAEAATIRVPADAATIQQAIDAAAAGDTVLVSPGTYVENITFRGQAITVASEQGPAVTIIDGNRAGSVVTFASGENRTAVLAGFTIRNGANSFSGGGLRIQNSAPSIIGNWIVNNGACSGAGIYSYSSSPLTKGNTISRNYVYACSGASGLGVYIGGDSAAELVENVITENSGAGSGQTASLRSPRAANRASGVRPR